MKRVISAASRSASLGCHSGVWALDMRVFSRLVDHFGLRGEFPVLRTLAYLNAGTDGPLPARAVAAAAEELEREAAAGRTFAHFERRNELNGLLRRALAAAGELSGVSVREAPLPELAEAVGPSTRLVACSHVGWVSGLLAPAEL